MGIFIEIDVSTNTQLPPAAAYILVKAASGCTFGHGCAGIPRKVMEVVSLDSLPFLILYLPHVLNNLYYFHYTIVYSLQTEKQAFLDEI